MATKAYLINTENMAKFNLEEGSYALNLYGTDFYLVDGEPQNLATTIVLHRKEMKENGIERYLLMLRIKIDTALEQIQELKKGI